MPLCQICMVISNQFLGGTIMGHVGDFQLSDPVTEIHSGIVYRTSTQRLCLPLKSNLPKSTIATVGVLYLQRNPAVASSLPQSFCHCSTWGVTFYQCSFLGKGSVLPGFKLIIDLTGASVCVDSVLVWHRLYSTN